VAEIHQAAPHTGEGFRRVRVIFADGGFEHGERAPVELQGPGMIAPHTEHIGQAAQRDADPMVVRSERRLSDRHGSTE